MGKAQPIVLPPMLDRIKFFFDILAKSSEAYFFATDIGSGLTMISENWVNDFGLKSGTVIRDMGEAWMSRIHPDDLPRFVAVEKAIFVEHKTDERRIDYRARNRFGEYVWLKCRGRLLKDGKGKPIFFGGIMTRLEHLNEADGVTGLLSKAPFQRAISDALDEFRRTGVGGAILMLGLDNFKIVNETYSRSFGDAVLKETAKQISNMLQQDMMLYKLDGDEFAILMPGAGETQTAKLFRAIQKCMTRQQFIDGKMYFCTVSGGTVFYPQSGREVMTLYKHAEAALDLAKQGGKNQHVVFTREQYNRWMRGLAMRDTIKTSVENRCEGFSLFYQPQVDSRTRGLVGAEALLRWKNPKGRMVAPMEFVPILEDTKMILPLGKWIVEEALNTCRKWRETFPDFVMSVNVSYIQIKDVTFFPFVVDAIKRVGLPPSALMLELTESTIVSDWTFLNQQFDEFRRIGIGIAMDDFGTGYSSLAYLKNLSCDVVKIDREFVKNILHSEFDCELVSYIVKLCHSMNMRVCIEGVEETDVFDIVANKCGADHIQGYLFGRPVSSSDFEEQYFEALAPKDNGDVNAENQKG